MFMLTAFGCQATAAPGKIDISVKAGTSLAVSPTAPGKVEVSAKAGTLPAVSSDESSPVKKEGSPTYQGIKYDSSFSVFAKRIERINSGRIAGGMHMSEKDYNLYKNMDVEEHINDLRTKNKELGIVMDEEAFDNMRKGFTMMKGFVNGDAWDDVNEEVELKPEYSPFGGFFIKDIPDDDYTSGLLNDYDPNDWERTAEWALSVAEDMAAASMFGVYDPTLLKAGGLAVSLYPHPLVLSNYASLISYFSPIDALFFYFGALEYEPTNPVLLCNIAFTYYSMGDLDTALGYADIALQYNPESGPAYQLKTLAHLRDGNSVLAAETLFKSARDCFDAMTIELFESYLDEVKSFLPWWHTHSEKPSVLCRCMWPKEDEFPINDLILELMYEVAKKYVDTEDVNQSVDSPTAQLTIKPYPSFGGPEDYMFSLVDCWRDLSDYNGKEADKAIKKIWELNDKIFKFRRGEAEILTPVTTSGSITLLWF
jgi:tetratricopeptide (TPR) repeat protein